MIDLTSNGPISQHEIISLLPDLDESKLKVSVSYIRKDNKKESTISCNYYAEDKRWYFSQ